jgi:hypothetical protein
MKFCVYTRAFHENPFLDFFIEHYIKLGFDKIIILKSDNIPYECPNEYIDYIDIHIVKNLGNKLITKYDYLIKNSIYDWILCIDIDEILLLNEKYKNIHEFVEEKLLLNKDINIFFFRWAMIEKYNTSDDNSLTDILVNYKIFTNKFIKHMVKRTELLNFRDPHFSNMKKQVCIYFENNIINQNNTIHNFSIHMYKESVLLHIHTRSIHNSILKSFITVLHQKKIKNKNNFINYINNFDNTKDDDKLFKKFNEYIGKKCSLVFAHSKNKYITLENFRIPEYKNKLFERTKDEASIINCLNQNNVNITKYFQFIEKINTHINENFKNLLFN